MTIFALGIMPYISSAIIMQLMTAVSPYFAQLKKEGAAGRENNAVHSLWDGIFWQRFKATAFRLGWKALQGAGVGSYRSRIIFRFTTVVTLVGGTMFLMWLGEQITSRGVGNGISSIILRGSSLIYHLLLLAPSNLVGLVRCRPRLLSF